MYRKARSQKRERPLSFPRRPSFCAIARREKDRLGTGLLIQRDGALGGRKGSGCAKPEGEGPIAIHATNAPRP